MGRRKEEALKNEQVRQTRENKKRIKWIGWALGGQQVWTEVDADHGGRAQRNSRVLCWYTRHWETHSLIHTLTRPRTQAQASAHCCTDLRWHLRGQPLLQFSPECRS